VNRRPKLEIVAPNATPEEAAAVVGALERFMRETAPVRVDTTSQPSPSPWIRAARQEAVDRWPA
jgi:hypothetical protein